MFKTTFLTREEALSRRRWILVDAEGWYLGKLSVYLSDLLRGKNTPDFTPRYDCGAFIVVINSSKILLSGNKHSSKFWYRHSGYPGGLKKRNGAEMIRKYPEKMIRLAVKGMLPKNRYLSRALLSKLKIYRDETHPHSAQLSNS